MPSKVYDRDEFRAMQRQRTAQGRRQERDAARAAQRQINRGAFRDFWKALWGGIFRVGMYSSDPEIARIGMIQTAERELARQRQITVAQRAEDQARDDERMTAMAQHMAHAMFDEAERRGTVAGR